MENQSKAATAPRRKFKTPMVANIANSGSSNKNNISSDLWLISSKNAEKIIIKLVEIHKTISKILAISARYALNKALLLIFQSPITLLRFIVCCLWNKPQIANGKIGNKNQIDKSTSFNNFKFAKLTIKLSLKLSLMLSKFTKSKRNKNPNANTANKIPKKIATIDKFSISVFFSFKFKF